MGPLIFSGNTFGALTQALDAASLRQETIASNLANANTPGYRRKDVAFALELGGQEDRLRLARTSGRHLLAPGGSGEPAHVVSVPGGAMRLDGNTVDPDAEAARLAETEITYAALTGALVSQFAGLRIAITGSAR